MSNEDQLLDVIRTLDPELYLIKIVLKETNVNPRFIPRLLRQVANLGYGTGFGKIQVFMSDGVITQIKGEESDQLNVTVFEK